MSPNLFVPMDIFGGHRELPSGAKSLVFLALATARPKRAPFRSEFIYGATYGTSH
ncbi:MAG: hypothetical protein WAL71_17875 [Terriglobales bacterium]